jgi:hypothetical protein
MTENEIPPDRPEVNAPTTSGKPIISRLTPAQIEITKRPAGEWVRVLVVGFKALESGDLRLSEAAARHVIDRAESGSGGLCRAMVLLSEVYDRKGNRRLSDQLMESVCTGRF